MNGLFLYWKQRVHALMAPLFVLMMLAGVAGSAALPSELQGATQPPAPTLEVTAPASVALGERIEIQLTVKNANGIAGYETHVLFDTSAAHFSGLHQRQNDLKKLGRDVIPLEAAELPEGAAIGLASCKFSDCVHPQGNGQPGGAQGTVRLATVLIGTDQEGQLEIALDNTIFVDASGNRVAVEIPTPRLYVQVGPQNGNTHSAPASNGQGSPSTPAPRPLDLTGDGQVSYADAIEVAIEWTLSREKGQPCGSANDLSRDVNGDGCVDVVDIQLILANAGSTQGAPGDITGSAEQPAINSDSVDTAENLEPAQTASALTFTVNSTSDAADSNVGDGICASSAGCTLRAAIQEANAHFGSDTIRFNIPGTGVQTIQLASRLPSLSDGSGGTTIDGYSQPGAQPNSHSQVSNAQIMIQVRGNGASAFDAMMVQSANNRIQGLAIFNARRSIWFYGIGATGNVLAGSFIGTNAAGTFVAPAYVLGASGLVFESGAARNQIGGTAAAQRNVISGNARHGFDLRSEASDNNVIVNNLIGLAPSGDRRLQNLKHGVDINTGSSDNVIGGTASGERNIISGNGESTLNDFTAGVEISHDTLTQNNRVIGNCFGTDPTCTTAPDWAYNSHYAIRMEDGVNHNVIANNVIGNSRHGAIKIDHPGTDFNHVYNNRIGVSLNGSAIPNSNFSILIGNQASHTTIGPNNIIANSPLGVRVAYLHEDFNTITRNSIYNHAHLGIDVGPYQSVNPNDVGDTDTGANEELNWPVLQSATTSQVTGTACAEAIVPKPCTIEIFIAERRTNDAGSGNYGQGKTFVGSATTNSNGSFTVAISGVVEGQYLTATATDAAENTSEFSWNIRVSGSGTSPTPTPTSTPTQGPTPTPTATPTPSSNTTLASDQFTRTIVDGWGSANVGGSYTLSGLAADFDVNGSAGTVRIPQPDRDRTAFLGSVSAQDVEVSFRVRTDKVASGGNEFAYFVARRVSSNTEYRVKIRFSTSQTIHLRAERLNSGSKADLGTEVRVSGLTHTANSYIRIRAQVIGANPTTIRIKAWADGQAEPSNWQYSVTDSTTNLQTAGSVGLRVYLASSATNAPVVFTFDDFLVTAP